MNISLMTKIKNWFIKASLFKKIIIAAAVVGFGWLLFSLFFAGKKATVKYQTAQVLKGTLIVSVAGSGQVSTANNGTIATLATGVVSKLYVKDGDEVKTGDKIAEVDLDLSGQQNAAQALASYQSAKNNLESVKTNLYTLQSDMFTYWKKHYDLATNSTYQNSDGTPNNTNRALAEYHIADDNWLASEAKYKNQQNVVSQAQISLRSSWLSYQQSSSTIYAPLSGIVLGLSLQTGSVIVASQNTSNSAQSATKIASIKTKALPTISVNLTEIDVPKVKIGDMATVKFDALSDKTFTGKVASIDTAGVVSSGVTTYPTTIRLDSESDSILSNMAASANIIVAVKNNVLIVPAASVQKQNEELFVRVMKNGQVQEVTVETGLSSSSEVEIISGLSEGDTVVTNIISSAGANQQTGTQTQSPFGGIFGGSRTGFGGANIRIRD